MKKVCECGCGQEVKEENKFIRGHWNFLRKGKNNPLYGKRGINSPNYGSHRKEITKRKISESKIGKYHSEEWKRKIRENARTNPNFGMKNKNMSEKSRGKMSKTRIKRGLGKLEKNPRWIGGKSFEPYTPEFNNVFKLMIRQRDGFVCLKCGMKEEDCLKLFGRVLSINHINYNKELTIPENCCCLCVRCNSEVNSNRIHWTKFFQSILSERYGYKYENNLPIINLEIK